MLRPISQFGQLVYLCRNCSFCWVYGSFPSVCTCYLYVVYVIVRNSAVELGETILPPPELFDTERCCSSLGSDQTMFLLPPPAEFDNVSRYSSTTDLPLPPPPSFFDDSQHLSGLRLACLRSAQTSEVSMLSSQVINLLFQCYEWRSFSLSESNAYIGWAPWPGPRFPKWIKGKRKRGGCEREEEWEYAIILSLVGVS